MYSPITEGDIKNIPFFAYLDALWDIIGVKNPIKYLTNRSDKLLL